MRKLIIVLAVLLFGSVSSSLVSAQTKSKNISGLIQKVEMKKEIATVTYSQIDAMETYLSDPSKYIPAQHPTVVIRIKITDRLHDFLPVSQQNNLFTIQPESGKMNLLRYFDGNISVENFMGEIVKK